MRPSLLVPVLVLLLIFLLVVLPVEAQFRGMNMVRWDMGRR